MNPINSLIVGHWIKKLYDFEAGVTIEKIHVMHGDGSSFTSIKMKNPQFPDSIEKIKNQEVLLALAIKSSIYSREGHEAYGDRPTSRYGYLEAPVTRAAISLMSLDSIIIFLMRIIKSPADIQHNFIYSPNNQKYFNKAAIVKFKINLARERIEEIGESKEEDLNIIVNKLNESLKNVDYHAIVIDKNKINIFPNFTIEQVNRMFSGSESEIIQQLAELYRFTRIYKFAKDFGDKVTHTNYHVCTNATDEFAFFQRPVHNVTLVYDRGKVVNQPVKIVDTQEGLEVIGIEIDYLTELIIEMGIHSKPLISKGAHCDTSSLVEDSSKIIPQQFDEINYPSVKIGNQIWMSKNLDVDKFQNGDPIPHAKTKDEWYSETNIYKRPVWCYYGYDSKNGNKFGKLYNWYAVIDPRKLAPAEWHIPTDDEWSTLEEFLGRDAGSKMKHTTGWERGYNGTNSSGFSGIPGGSYSGSDFYHIEFLVEWWSFTEFSYDQEISSLLEQKKYEEAIANLIKRIKEDPDPRYFAMLTMAYSFTKQFDLAEQAYQQARKKDSSKNKIKKVPSNNKGNTKVCTRYLLYNSSGLKKGNTPKEHGLYVRCISDSIEIGEQIWMPKNLDVDKFQNGDAITEFKTPKEWQMAIENKQPGWCYYDNKTNKGKKYGKLYNWYAVNDPRGLAPKGWHIPSHADWTKLINYFGGKSKYLGGNYVSSDKIKNKTGWEEHYNGTNESGFSGSPVGYRENSKFVKETEEGRWWSSTEYDTGFAVGGKQLRLVWFCSVDRYHLDSYFCSKEKGFSVRCIRDDKFA